MKAFLKSFATILLRIVLFIVAVLAILGLINLIATSNERNNLSAPGKLVSVGRVHIHVLTLGEGQNRIVILPGGGNPAPSIDFRPLIDALKPSFKVSLVEPLGYGWSDGSQDPRTLDRQLEEARSALIGAGQAPPYILVPHSISGLLALLWVKEYPEEVSAIVGLDSSVPELGQLYPDDPGPNFNGLLRSLGIVRLALLINPGFLDLDTMHLTESEKRDYVTLANWNFNNDTTYNEQLHIKENCLRVQGVKIPDTIPTTFILSYENVADSGTIGFSWQGAHQKIIEGNKTGRIVVVKGSHYFYRDHVNEVVDEIRNTAHRLP